MSDPIPSSAIYDATVGGLSLIVVAGGSTGDALVQQSDGTYAPVTVAAGISGSTGATDNSVLRSDGAGGSTIQSSAVSINDSGYLSAARLRLGTTSSEGMLKQGTSTEAGNVPGVVVKDATDAGYMALHARRLTASEGLLGCWNGSDWNGWAIYQNLLVGTNAGRIAWSNGSSSLAGTEVLKQVMVSSGVMGICGNGGLKVQNFAGNSDAPLTCSSITLSGAENKAPITKAALLLLTPTAASAGRWRVTDATPASREAYPDGTNWRYTSDDTVVT